MPRITVTGATSLIGHFLLPILHQTHEDIRAVSRKPVIDGTSSPEIKWLQADISKTPVQFDSDEILVSLTPIWVLSDLLETTNELPSRILAFSSTSVKTKSASPDLKERLLATQLLQGEKRLKKACEEHGCSWTLFRPTLVYGSGLDQNVSNIARLAQKLRFFPVLGQATGLRSPVHAEDLAIAITQCMDNPNTINREYNLSGAEDLPYNEMINRIFLGLGQQPRTIKIPASLARSIIRLVRLHPRFADLTPQLINRTADDLIFDYQDATEDFGYTPRAFFPTKEDLYENEKTLRGPMKDAKGQDQTS